MPRKPRIAFLFPSPPFVRLFHSALRLPGLPQVPESAPSIRRVGYRWSIWKSAGSSTGTGSAVPVPRSVSTECSEKMQGGMMDLSPGWYRARRAGLAAPVQARYSSEPGPIPVRRRPRSDISAPVRSRLQAVKLPVQTAAKIERTSNTMHNHICPCSSFLTCPYGVYFFPPWKS